MIYVARLEDGIVAQVVVVSDDYEFVDDEALIGPDNTVGVGWAYVDGEFVDPDKDEQEQQENFAA